MCWHGYTQPSLKATGAKDDYTIYIIRIFTQGNPSVQCTVINGVLDIELN